MMIHKFAHNGLNFEIGIPDGMSATEAQHAHLLRVDPQYRWLSFRRALLASPEYPLAVALALDSPGLALADAKLTSAIDACLNQGAEPEEIAAFQSALGLYLSQLPDSPDGAAISSAIQSLCAEYSIPGV